MNRDVYNHYMLALANKKSTDVRLEIPYYLFYSNVRYKDLFGSLSKLKQARIPYIIHPDATDSEGRVLSGYKAVYLLDIDSTRQYLKAVLGEFYVEPVPTVSWLDKLYSRLKSIPKEEDIPSEYYTKLSFAGFKQLVERYILSTRPDVKVEVKEEKSGLHKDTLIDIIAPDGMTEDDSTELV